MNEFEYLIINGHLPIDPQSDINERFGGDRIPDDWDDPKYDEYHVVLKKFPICWKCDEIHKCKCEPLPDDCPF